MKKVNIMFVIPQLERGGTENLVLNLIKRLNSNCFKTSLIYCNFFGNSQFLNEFIEAGASLYYIPKKKRLDLITMKKISDIININNIDIVNAHHFFSFFYSYYGCKIRRRIKLILTNHSSWEFENITWKSSLVGRLLLKNIDKIIGVTDEVTKRSVETYHIDPSKACTILNGVDVDNFSFVKNREKIRREFDVDQKTIVIGVIANFRRVKNHVFLIKAINKLISLNKNIKILLVGQDFKNDSENSLEEVRSLVTKLGLENNVLFLGYRIDTPDLLSGLDIFCLTSLKEGLPISVIEAMAAGLPVIGTNVEGIRDVIVPNQNGLLVELGDVEGLTNALLCLLENPEYRERLGRAARKTAEEKYSLGRCVTEYEKLFLSTLPTSERYRQNKSPD